MKIEEATDTSGRKAKLQFWVSDWSGHEAIIDFLKKNEEKSQSEIGIAALALLAKNQGFLDALPSASRVTTEMRDLVRSMRQNQDEMKQRQKQLEEMQNLVIDLLKNAHFDNSEHAAEFNQRLSDIQKMAVIEGAGNYGGTLYEVQEDEFGEW